jgi:3-oxoacyl-[acyl-carrier protein] reductase
MQMPSGEKNRPLSGKVAIVTGGGHGIGEAIAARLASDGAMVVVGYRSSGEEARSVVKSIRDRGGDALEVEVDMGSPEKIRELFRVVDEQSGRLDILVNNAAITPGARLSEISDELLDNVLAVNVKGLVLASQEAARRLRSGGRIVSISSSTVQAPTLGMSLYAGSKAAGDMFTRVWGKELASRGITVNSVAPGPTSPGSFDRASSELRQRALEESPSGRIGTAAEIASVVAFLCGDEASWISGQCVIVNGAGW